MVTEYPYMISNNKIKPILDSIETASRPPKFSHSFLKKLGYSSSNDRAVIPLLKKLEFIHDDGTPTEHYNQLKDKTRRFHILGERVKDLYAELYGINTTIHSAGDEAIKGAISRVTGKDAKTVNRYFATFKALTKIARYSAAPPEVKPKKPDSGNDKPPPPPTPPQPTDTKMSFQYNIQIHLPATTDISVYNAIFKSLKENLGI